MFNNIGKKIKTCAIVVTIIGIIDSVIFGFIVMLIREGDIPNIIIGFLVMIIGSFLSWISSFLLYGFGELIDKTCDIHSKICNSYNYTQNKNLQMQKWEELGLVDQNDIMENLYGR